MSEEARKTRKKRTRLKSDHYKLVQQPVRPRREPRHPLSQADSERDGDRDVDERAWPERGRQWAVEIKWCKEGVVAVVAIEVLSSRPASIIPSERGERRSKEGRTSKFADVVNTAQTNSKRIATANTPTNAPLTFLDWINAAALATSRPWVGAATKAAKSGGKDSKMSPLRRWSIERSAWVVQK
jgi:hypothetical protein